MSEGVTDPLHSFLHLMWNSDVHRTWSLSRFRCNVIPPLMKSQFMLWHHEGQPIGGVTWAFLSDDVAEAYKTRDVTFEWDDWSSGSQLWFMDFICPYGGARHAVRAVQRLFTHDFDEAFSMRTKIIDGKKVKRVIRHGQFKPATPDPAYAWPDKFAPGLH